jgi:hypothetical protein
MSLPENFGIGPFDVNEAAPAPAAVAHGTIGEESYATPPKLVDEIRLLLTEIDLDPATSADFNAHAVRATRYHTKEDNGLDREWHGRVYLNPPGGKAKPRAAAWWKHLCGQYELGNVSEAVYLSFALDAFQWSQGKGQIPIQSFPTLTFAKRLKFFVMRDGVFTETKNPIKPCALTWLPPLTLPAQEVREVFEEFAAGCARAGYPGVVTYGPEWL